MSDNVVVPKPNNRRGAKVKSGCGTCRIRRIKCDEGKPSCQKCLTTGRTCDGYESPFKPFVNQIPKQAQGGSVIASMGLSSVRSGSVEITPRDIELLNHYFPIKTFYGTQIFCEEAAKQILQAGLTDPTVRHAISSLQALCNDLEASTKGAASIQEATPNYQYGLEQYSRALRGLASNLANPSSLELKSALYCCPILIGIEQARRNYAAMGHHIVGGLKIMREHQVRPFFASPGTLVPTMPDQLPYLDVFIIRLFAAPCKYADSPTPTHVFGVTAPLSESQQKPDMLSDFRTIAPNMRTELLNIGTSIIHLLGKVSQIQSSEAALQLLSDKADLLVSLESWLTNLDAIHKELGSQLEPVPVHFMRFFHQTMKVVLMGTLHVESSPDFQSKLQLENERLQTIANTVDEKVKNFVFSIKTGGDQKKRSKSKR
ncbi:hypothetical protein DM02DRAFT_99661 [Periconia macrospinosa]|uniref:Zn(2)-C6 fungal-type domain-containing protein n=1 Tax=Periconia macrospinosa TaxID=97972 RepID=A0A2V1E4N0_9PLEO|nr:hypothetical protein DM02DRAFT_99661 [Periconia macrospinosa]